MFLVFLTCIDGGGVVPRIVGTVTFPRELSDLLVNALIVPGVVSTPRVVGICSANEQLIIINFGQHSDIVVTLVVGLPLHQTQLRVPLLGVPGDPGGLVLLEAAEAEVVDHVPRPDQQRVPVLLQQLEVVRVGLIAREGENLICKGKKNILIVRQIIFTIRFVQIQSSRREI